MREELDKKLCADYPEIFRDRHADMRLTCMCWGFDCGDGWYPLIDSLCFLLSANVISLQRDVEHISSAMKEESNKENQSIWAKNYYTQDTLNKKLSELDKAKKAVPVATQVKEKFGTLRFYVDKATDKQYNFITFAEVMSGKTCETCGTTKDVFQTRGWIKTTCVTCSPEEWIEHNSD